MSDVSSAAPVHGVISLGDRQAGDKPTGRQTTGRHILVNWATEVETTGLQLWKCERLTIAVLEHYVQTYTV